MTQNQSELRIFISSTFQDLQEEREYLLKRVFPEIRQLCRERGVEFTEIDLRWGLTEEEATHGKIIRTCLEEIDRCRPYFIGILGERYGWAPKFHEIQKDAELVRKYPWIEDAAADGASIVEMEFDYGVLRDPSQAIGAYFYFKKYPEPHPTTDENSKRLEALKKRARTSRRPVKDFSTAAELGESVRNDLKRLIELHWHKEANAGELETERASHEAFASTRRRAYIINPKYLKQFNDFTAGSGDRQILAITGPSGIGKSSLVAYLAQNYQRHHSNAFVIAHYIGSSTSTADHSGILRHICLEIKDRLNLEDELPATTEQLSTALPEWLAKVQEEPLVIFIDALNQLEDGASLALGWLPEFLPPNVKLICSTTEGESLDAILKRSPEELAVNALNEEEGEAIIVRFLGEYHKSLSHAQTRRVAQDPKSASPLFLRTLLEELRLTGNFERIDELISHYLSSTDTADLFRRVLERIEGDYAPELVEEFMSLLWCARKGLSESELLDLLTDPSVSADQQPFARIDLSLLLTTLDFHLIRKDGLLGFFHNYLRDAVETRYLADEDIKRRFHKRLAQYFRTLPPAKRRADEEPWQWQRSEIWEELRDTLVDLNLFSILASNEKQYELLGYWRKLKGKYDLIKEYERVITEQINLTNNKKDKVDILLPLVDFIMQSSFYEEARGYLMYAIELSKQAGSSELEIAEIEERLANLYADRWEYSQAEQLFAKVTKIYTEHYGYSSEKTINSIKGYARVLISNGNFDEGKILLENILSIFKTNFGAGHIGLVPILNELATCYYRLKEERLAIQMLRQSIGIIEGGLGRNNFEILGPLNNLGMILRTVGEMEEALTIYNRALDLAITYLGHEHIFTARLKYNIGILFLFQEDYQQYVNIFDEVMQVFIKRLGIANQNTLLPLKFLCSESHRSYLLKQLANKWIGYLLGLCTKDSQIPSKVISEFISLQENLESNSKYSIY